MGVALDYGFRPADDDLRRERLLFRRGSLTGVGKDA